MPVFLEKMVPGTEEALAPATRGRASCLLLNSYKENAHPLIDVYEGKISLDEFTAQLDDDDLIHLLGA
ncbi:Beta-glucosidase-related glycosidase, partial [human gut metagenome]